MNRKIMKAVFYALNIVMAVIIIAPIVYCFNVSMMSLKEVFAGKFWPGQVMAENYVRAVQLAPFFTFIKNSLITSGIITIGQIITGALAAYAFSMMKFRGRNVLFLVMLSTMMIPSQAIIIANYLTICDWNLKNTYTALVLPNMATAFAVFNMRQAFLQLPYEIALPLVRASMGALGIYTFLQSWNYYLWPLLITDTVDMRTVQIGLGMLQGAEATDFRPVMAGSMIILVPSILAFVLGQKQLISGLTSGSVKG